MYLDKANQWLNDPKGVLARVRKGLLSDLHDEDGHRTLGWLKSCDYMAEVMPTLLDPLTTRLVFDESISEALAVLKEEPKTFDILAKAALGEDGRYGWPGDVWLEWPGLAFNKVLNVLSGGSYVMPDRASAGVGFHLTFEGAEGADDAATFDYTLWRCDMTSINRETYAAESSDHIAELLGASVAATLADVLKAVMVLVLSKQLVTKASVEPSAKLNRARRTRGKPELADHVTVTMDIGGSNGTGSGSGGGGTKRLHGVRGHYVHRGDTVFWRKPHVRGSGTMVRKDIRVTNTGG